jgi:4-hydroxy-3-methylbut-2-enyl diphosphate reductase
MKKFNVPSAFRSELISSLKVLRQQQDPKRKDLSPSIVDLGPVSFVLARHFGFCYGVENAIDIAYRALEENPDKRVFLLSEMIHNPEVNQDLIRRGARFLMSAAGEELIPLNSLHENDIVIVPAFGTTIELQERLREQGVNPSFYDTTCPFVEKVWKRSRDLAERGFSVIIHGKPRHEETRATFSQTLGASGKSGSVSGQTTPRLVIVDRTEAEIVVRYIKGDCSREEFFRQFHDRVSEGFDPDLHLQKIGVVNQTTMLATETHELSSAIREALSTRYGAENLAEHFGDTRDTLCYATYENQTATMELLKAGADLAVIIGGYNSSNTSHLVELCEEVYPSYFVQTEAELLSPDRIRHFSLKGEKVIESENWLPSKRPLKVVVTSGASCPDILVEQVMRKVAEFVGVSLDQWSLSKQPLSSGSDATA